MRQRPTDAETPARHDPGRSTARTRRPLRHSVEVPWDLPILQLTYSRQSHGTQKRTVGRRTARRSRLAVATLAAGLVALGPLTAEAVPQAGSAAAIPATTATTGLPAPASPSPPTPTPSPTQTLPIFATRTPPVGGERLTGARLITDLPVGVPAPPEFKAGAYLIADLDSGEVIATKAPHAMYLPASTMKTLTTLALVHRLSPSTQVKAEFEDAAVDGTKVGMDPGAPYPVESLFSALMMASANDAAVALARVNGGLEPTTHEMNAVARHLGALDTTAKNTSGLDAPGQLTSVYDLALIGRAAVNDADIRPLLTRKIDDFPGGRTKKGQQRTTMQIANHNKLLWNYDGTIGVKNGYTNAAGATYIGAVRRGERAYIFTYLKAESGAWRPTAEMFDWAFAHGDRARSVGRLVEPGELEKEAAHGGAGAPGVADAEIPGGAAAGPAVGGDTDSGFIASAKGLVLTALEAGTGAAEGATSRLPSPFDDPRVTFGGLAGLLVLGIALGARLRRR